MHAVSWRLWIGILSCVGFLMGPAYVYAVHDPDVNNDGVVTLLDILFVSSCFGQNVATPPLQVAITAPPDGSTVTASPIPITGTVEVATATVAVNGVPATMQANGTFTATVALQEGPNTLVATAAMPPPKCLAADLNHDGRVGKGDLKTAVSNFWRGGFSVTDPSLPGRTGITSSTVTLATPDMVPPTVTLSVPAAALPGETIAATVEAHDASGIATVSLRLEGVLLATAAAPPFVFPVVVPANTPGGSRLTLTAEVHDGVGNVAQEHRTLTVQGARDTVPPTVLLTGPAAATPAGTIMLTVTAQDNVQVAQLTLKQQDIVLQSHTTPPFVLQHDFTITAQAAVGTTLHFTAQASDTSHNLGTAMLTVTVVDTPDTTPPSVTIAAPLQTGPGTVIPLTATASDGSGIVAVTFTDAGSFSVIDTSPPYATSYLVPPHATPGAIIPLTATAKDYAGLHSTASVDLTIVDTVPPGVTLSAPSVAMAGRTVPVTATAIDNVQVTVLNLHDGTRTVTDREAPFVIQHTFAIPDTASVGEAFSFTAAASDAAGNAGTASATVRVVGTPDMEPPIVALHAPATTAPGDTLRLTATATDNADVAEVMFLLAGSTSPLPAITDVQAPYEATFTISNSVVVGSQLMVTATVRDTSDLTATATQMLTVVATPDTTPPTAEISAPTTVLPGETVTVTVAAQDNIGIASTRLFVDGSLVSVAVTAPSATLLSIPQGAIPETFVALRAEAEDFAGNLATAQAAIAVVSQRPGAGLGLLVGEVYDDRTGLWLAEAEVTLLDTNTSAVQTDRWGRYALEANAGTAHLRIAKPGFTSAYRTAQVEPGLSTVAFDTRLTQLDMRAQRIAAALGGIATSADSTVSVIFAAGALGLDQEIQVTPVSGQGLQGRLPFGWFPLVTVDVAPGGLAFNTPATLLAPNTAGMPSGTAIAAILWDSGTRRWTALSTGTVTSEGTHIRAELPRSGQVTFVLPDPDNTLVPVPGEPLPGVPAVPLSQASAEVTPQPPVLVTQLGERALVTIQVMVALPLPSGTPVQARIREHFDLANGSQLHTPPYTQDLALYHTPNEVNPLALTALFPVTPSRTFTPAELRLGVIDLNVRLPSGLEQPLGAVIGVGGGTVLGSNGERVTIPAGALTANTAVTIESVAPVELAITLPDTVTLVTGFALDLHGAVLIQPGQFSLPLPSGVSPGNQLMVAQVVEVSGGTRLVFVGTALVVENFLVVDAAGTAVPGVLTKGRYLILKVANPVGFVTGTVLDTTGAPAGQALVSVNTLPLVALTKVPGTYTLPTLVQPFTLMAVDLRKGDIGRANGMVTMPRETVTVDLRLAVTSPTVVSVSPEDDATGVPLTTTVSVTFSEAIKPSTLLGTSHLTLTSSAGVVTGEITLSADNTVAIFTPSTPLTPETPFTLTLTADIMDRHERPLTAFSSTFTTADVTPPLRPPAGQISIALPINGIARVTGTQGAIVPSDLVIVTNLTTGATTTAVANADGSFSAGIALTLGDEVRLTVQDQAGNRTHLERVPFVDANGESVSIIGSAGGAVAGAGNVQVEVPAGAVPSGTVVRLRPLTEQDYPVPPPANFRFLGAVALDIGAVTVGQGLKVSIPTPPGTLISGQIMVVQPFNIGGMLRLSPIDDARLSGDRITTASPPYPGVRQTGEIAFLESVAVTLQTASIVTPLFPGAVAMFIGAFPDFFYSVGLGPIAAIAPVNQPLTLDFVDLAGEVIHSVAHPPLPPGPPVLVCLPTPQGNDTPPAVVFSSPASGAAQVAIDTAITVDFNEPMLPCTLVDALNPLNANFKLFEAATDRQLEGQIMLAGTNQTLVFLPRERLKYSTEYRYTLAGAQDESGAGLEAFEARFQTFTPRVIGRFSFPAGSEGRAKGIDYLGTTKTVLLTNAPLVNEDITGLILVDVTDPASPQQLGDELSTTGRANDVVVLKNSFAGDLALVVSGSSQVFGNLRVYDMNDPVATANRQGNFYLGARLLSTPPGLNPRDNIPPQPGIPQAVAAAGDQVAYVANVPLGLQAVGIPQTLVPRQPPQPQPPIEGLFGGNFSAVDFSGGKVLAVGRLKGGGFGLTVLNPDLTLPQELPPMPGALRVKGLEGFTIAVDTENDGTIDEQRIYNLVLVSGGSQGGLRVVSLNRECSPTSFAPCELGTIPTVIANKAVPAFEITVDGPTNLVYVSSGRAPAVLIIDFSRLFDTRGTFKQGRQLCDGQPCIDVDGDRTDDRILGTVDIDNGIAVESALDPARGLLYLASDQAGLHAIQVRPTLVFLKSVTVDGRTFVSSGGVTSDEEILIFDRNYTNFCLDIGIQSNAGTQLNYEILETPAQSGSPILAFRGNQSGSLTATSPPVCLDIDRAALAGNTGSHVVVRITDQGGTLLRELGVSLGRPRIDSPDELRIATHVDRLNHQTCPGSAYFTFALTVVAEVTLRVNGNVVQDAIDERTGSALGPFENRPFPAGIHTITLFATTLLPGDNPYTLTASNIPDYASETLQDNGTIVHEAEIHASLPLGHTMIKGVDIWDGHLTHSSQDIHIPGRGLDLDFMRTYSSTGHASDGPLGAGWTHSYNVRLIRDGCGRFEVIGGEGSGNAFTSPHKDPARAALFGVSPEVDFFQPQIGYHSTLLRDPQRPTAFDFFTKAHVRYHFQREPLLPGEVYTLRYIEEPNGNRITLDYLAGDGNATTLDAVTDASGRALVFEYEAYAATELLPKQRLKRLRGLDPLTGSRLLGLEVTYDYDAQFNLVQVTRSSPNPGANLNDARVESYTYTPGVTFRGHNLTSYTDPNGHTTGYVYYDDADNMPGFVASFGVSKFEMIRAVNQSEGVTTTFTYDFTNNTRVVTDPRSPRAPIPPTVYTLNTYGATVRIDAPLGKTTRMEWCTDAPHPACNGVRDVLLVAMIDAEGRTTAYEYLDGLGNVTRKTVRFPGNKAPVTRKDGMTSVTEVVTTYTYEPLFSKMTSKTDAEDNTTRYLIDAPYLDRPGFCPDPSPGRHTGKLLGVQDAESNVTCYAYAASASANFGPGDLVSVTDPRGDAFMTRYTRYDRYGNVIEVVDAVGNITTNVFDERSRLREIVDTFTHHRRYAYDGLDRKISEEQLDDRGEGGTPQTMTSLYTPNGELLELVDGLGQKTVHTYDGLNRRRFTTEEGIPDPLTGNNFLRLEYRYDEDDNVVEEIDYRGVRRIHTYDALNRRVSTVVVGPFTGPMNPDNVLMTSTYDLVNNKLSDTDLHGHTTTYVYDGLYRVAQTRLPFSHGFQDVPFQEATITTVYDRMGNKVRETDANGQATTYIYDNIYRLVQKTDADGNAITYAYDRANNKIREAHLSSGLVTEWAPLGLSAYDALNRPRAMRQTGPGLPTEGYLTRFDYEDSDNAVVVTNPRGFRTRTDMDGLDRVLQTTVDVGGLNLMTTYTYDGNGNVRTVQDPQGGDIDVTHVYDGLNRRLRSTYVATPGDAGQPVTEEFTYDGNNNLVRYKDKRNIVFTTAYDNLNRVRTKTFHETVTNGGAELSLVTYIYDDANTSVTETDANGNVTITRSDSLHRPATVDDADPNGLLLYEYDGVNKRAEIDKKGQRTEYDYDRINRLVDTREFDLTRSRRTALHTDYLDEQNRVEETDRRGIRMLRQLDALQRLVQLRRASLDMAAHYSADQIRLETHEYDGNDNKIAFIDGQGNRTEQTYDGADRRVTMTEGAGSLVAATTTYAYDNVNNLRTVKDGRTHGGAFDVQHTYDARYRRVTATNGELQTTTYAYDANNNLVRMTEPNGVAFTTHYHYDEHNKLLAVDETPRADALTATGVTRFFYDGNRNKIAQQDANGNLVTYRYDVLNRLTDTFQHTVAGALSAATTRGNNPRGSDFYATVGGDAATALHWQYGYDLNSNQNLVIDARGQRLDMTYDHLDRLEAKRYSNHAEPGLDFQMQSIVYTYDGNGNIVTITEVKLLAGVDVTEVTTQTFDPLERLQTRTHQDHDGTAKEIQYDYDFQGNRTAVKDPDSIITTYSYDARNRLQTATTEAGVTAYTWWEDSLPRRVEYANGTVSDYSDPNAYDRADRITLIVNHPNDLTQPFSRYTYTYDDNGNRLTQVETQRLLPVGNPNVPESTTYAYDNLNRLLTVTYQPTGNPVRTLAYTYAPNGNRLIETGTEPYTGQPIDRTYQYEALPGKPGVTFDHVNALTQIVDNLNAGQTVTYEYDPNLNQVAREQGGVRTDFRFGIRDEVLAAMERNGSPIAFDYNHDRIRVKKVSGRTGQETRYLHDDSAVLVEYSGTDPNRLTLHKYDYGHELLSFTEVGAGGQSRDSQFYLTDGLMSTANLTDEAGGLAHGYRYDAWGRVHDQVGTSENPRQYTSHYTDGETGLHYFGARYYDDETGRFLSQDSYLGEANTPPGLHRYLYAYANPLRFVDLTGYKPVAVTRDADPPTPLATNHVNGPKCIDNVCQRSDGTWVDREAVLTDADVKNPCAGETGPCNPRTKKLDDWLNKENEQELARRKTPLTRDLEEMERRLERATRLWEQFLEYQIALDRAKLAQLNAKIQTLEFLQRYGTSGEQLMYFVDAAANTVATAGDDPGIAQAVVAGVIHGAGSTVAGSLNVGAGLGKVSGKLAANVTPEILDYVEAAGDVARFLGPLGVALSNIKSAERIGTARRLVTEALKDCGCFVAGTTILTDVGQKRIEDVKVGDHIWSRHPTTGQEEFKRVTRVYITHPTRLVHLQYRPREHATRLTGEQSEDGDSGSEGDDDQGSDGVFEVIGTHGHPFWSAERQQWVAMGELRSGETLLLVGGQLAEVVERWVERPLKGATFTTYNFTVEDWHTYHVAPIHSITHTLAVWVHNASKCSVVWQIVDRFPAGSYESRQLRRFVKAWNEEIHKAGGSMVRRSLTAAEELASLAWKRAMRKAFPSRFQDKVVGHTPDAAAGGPVAGGKAMALDPTVNASIGGQVGKKPLGYKYGRVEVIRE